MIPLDYKLILGLRLQGLDKSYLGCLDVYPMALVPPGAQSLKALVAILEQP